MRNPGEQFKMEFPQEEKPGLKMSYSQQYLRDITLKMLEGLKKKYGSINEIAAIEIEKEVALKEFEANELNDVTEYVGWINAFAGKDVVEFYQNDTRAGRKYRIRTIQSTQRNRFA